MGSAKDIARARLPARIEDMSVADAHALRRVAKRWVRQNANSLPVTCQRISLLGLQARADGVGGTGENAPPHRRQGVLKNRHFGLVGLNGNRKQQPNRSALGGYHDGGRTLRMGRNDQAMARNPRRRHRWVLRNRGQIGACVVADALGNQNLLKEIEDAGRAVDHEIQLHAQGDLRAHQVATLVWQRIEAAIDRVAHSIIQLACQRIVGDGNAVVVKVAAPYRITEGERTRGGVGRLRRLGVSGVFADGQAQGQIVVTDDAHVVVELHCHFNALAHAVGAGCGRGRGDRDALNGRHDRVHAVSAVGSQRLEGSVDVGAAALDGAAHQGTWPGTNAYAVSIVVTRLHGIAESQRPGTAAVQQRCLTLRGTD